MYRVTPQAAARPMDTPKAASRPVSRRIIFAIMPRPAPKATRIPIFRRAAAYRIGADTIQPNCREQQRKAPDDGGEAGQQSLRARQVIDGLPGSFEIA